MWLPLVAHAMVNQVPVASTASEKVIVRSALSATPAALSVGVVLATVGAASLAVMSSETVVTAESAPLGSRAW